jgi:hypothetical protein
MGFFSWAMAKLAKKKSTQSVSSCLRIVLIFLRLQNNQKYLVRGFKIKASVTDMLNFDAELVICFVKKQ